MAADLAHWMGSDLNVAASGDLLTVTGVAKSQQRILRRLLTNGPIRPSLSGDYIWETGYGAGLAAKIGSPFTPRSVQALIRAQIFLEAAVARSPAPSITVTPFNTGMFVEIQYTDSDTGQIVPLSFTVTPPGQAS